MRRAITWISPQMLHSFEAAHYFGVFVPPERLYSPHDHGGTMIVCRRKSKNGTDVKNRGMSQKRTFSAVINSKYACGHIPGGININTSLQSVKRKQRIFQFCIAHMPMLRINLSNTKRQKILIPHLYVYLDISSEKLCH